MMTNTTTQLDMAATDAPVRMPRSMAANMPGDLTSQDLQPIRREPSMSLGTPAELLDDSRSRGWGRSVLVRLFLASVVVAIALMFFMPSVSHAADVINVNKADMSALQTLPDIGEKRAKAIMDYRKKNGGFGAKSDLLNVPGIGDKILKKISSRISTSGGVSKVKSDKTKKASKDSKKSSTKDAKKDSKKSTSKKAKSDDGKSKSKDDKKKPKSKDSKKKDAKKDKKKSKSKSSDKKKKKKKAKKKTSS